MSASESADLLGEAMDYLRCFNTFSSYLGKNREHSSLIYTRLGDKLDPSARNFETFPFGSDGDERCEGVRTTPLEQQALSEPVADHSPSSAASSGALSPGLAVFRAVPKVGAVVRALSGVKRRRSRRRYPHYEISEYSTFLSTSECEYLIDMGRQHVESADLEGGGNYFPELGRSIAPERGKAVVFRLLHEGTDERHPMALHLDEAVQSGEQ
jgi:hypothetical protein